MTILKRCPRKDCHELIPNNNRDCGKHGDEGHKCDTEGCNETIYGKAFYCAACRRKRRNECCKKTKERVTAAYEQIEIAERWVRKTEPPREMTMAEKAAWEKMIAKGEKQLKDLRQRLNPDLLAARKCVGAIASLPMI